MTGTLPQLLLKDYEERATEQELSPLELRFTGEDMSEINTLYIVGEVSR